MTLLLLLNNQEKPLLVLRGDTIIFEDTTDVVLFTTGEVEE
ncbi:MAG: hypothetical protein ACRD5H_09230 [Nitrososphaerales archaeon]